MMSGAEELLFAVQLLAICFVGCVFVILGLAMSGGKERGSSVAESAARPSARPEATGQAGKGR